MLAIRAKLPSLEAVTGTTRRAAVDYAIERSGWQSFLPDFIRGNGTLAARITDEERLDPWRLQNHRCLPMQRQSAMIAKSRAYGSGAARYHHRG